MFQKLKRLWRIYWPGAFYRFLYRKGYQVTSSRPSGRGWIMCLRTGMHVREEFRGMTLLSVRRQAVDYLTDK